MSTYGGRQKLYNIARRQNGRSQIVSEKGFSPKPRFQYADFERLKDKRRYYSTFLVKLYPFFDV